MATSPYDLLWAPEGPQRLERINDDPIMVDPVGKTAAQIVTEVANAYLGTLPAGTSPRFGQYYVVDRTRVAGVRIDPPAGFRVSPS